MQREAERDRNPDVPHDVRDAEADDSGDALSVEDDPVNDQLCFIEHEEAQLARRSPRQRR